jgi:hypothetical protein
MMMPAVAMTVMVVTVPAVRAALGLEGDLDLHEVGSETEKHILNNMVGTNAKNLVSNFCGQVPVAEVPSKAR